MKQFWILLVAGVAGCASNQSAAPNFINGYYYMAGDSDCVRSRVMSPVGIECLNSQNKVTGYRNPMTNQQLQMYQTNQLIASQQQAVSRASFDAQLAAGNQAMNDRSAKIAGWN